MKVNLLVEFNRKKYNLNDISHINKFKTMASLKNFGKYPSKITQKILNYKPVYT